MVAFRYRPAQNPDDYHRRLASAVIEDGLALVSSTELSGNVVLRMCPINPRTTDRDLVRTVDRVAEIAERLG